MAKLAEMLLRDPAGPLTSGAAFIINEPARETSTLATSPSWTVDFRENCKVVVARGDPIDDFSRARDSALSEVQRALDLLSVQGRGDYSVVDVAREHLVWWVADGRTTIRIVSVITQPLEIPGVQVSGGTPVPRPPISWHPSYRFYRLSQYTTDLADAYRNLFLALESLLSDLAPMKVKPNGKSGEGEGEWFRRALTEAGQLVDLGQFAPPGSSDPVDAVYVDLYERTRTATFHAKQGRPTFLSHEPAQRADLAAAVQRAMRLYLKLAEVRHHAYRSWSGFYSYGFMMSTGGIDDKVIVHVTDDEAPWSPDETVPNPTGGAVVTLPAPLSSELTGTFLKSFLAVGDVSSLEPVKTIRRIVTAVRDNGLIHANMLEGPLTLDGIDVLQFHFGLRGENVGHPRSDYAT